MPAIRDKSLRYYAESNPTAHGGDFRRTRWGRSRARPLALKGSIHLTLRSTKARGPWSFRQPHHAARIKQLIAKHAGKHKVEVISCANVGNHLHLHLRLTRLESFTPFIRALTAAIAMAVTGASRWRKQSEKFWDQRPFTRMVERVRDYLSLEDYIAVNELEGNGLSRKAARQVVNWRARWRFKAWVATLG